VGNDGLGLGSDGISRREALKRGLKLTGAVMWATPVVQAIGMSPALAQNTSPTCTVWYAVKIDPSDGPPPNFCIDISGQNNPNGVGQCLDVDDLDVGPTAGGCSHIVSVFAPPDSDLDWTVVLAPDCEFKVGFIKAGNDPCAPAGNWDPTTNTVTFPNTGSPAISHVELAFCCSD
jgi:hypothetical protein